MTCIQTQPCLNPQEDAMAGFDPQKLSRTKATARYLSCFIFLLFSLLRCVLRDEYSCCPELCFALNSISGLHIPIRASTLSRGKILSTREDSSRVPVTLQHT